MAANGRFTVENVIGLDYGSNCATQF